jgi:predicted PurR-regulated permease PerM
MNEEVGVRAASGVPPLPLSPGEEAERAHGSTETEAEATHGERSALGWAAIAAVAVVAWLVIPVGVGILVGALLAFALQPLFERLRPRLGAHLPSLVTFAALLGGVQVFGLKGLLLGPVLMSLAIVVLRLYATEARKRRMQLQMAG